MPDSYSTRSNSTNSFEPTQSAATARSTGISKPPNLATAHFEPTHLTKYQTPEGIELLIDRATGAAYANTKAIARMCSTPERKVDATLIRKYAKTLIQGGVKIEPISLEIETRGGVQGVSLYDEKAVVKFVNHYNPTLGEAFMLAGARAYLHQLANYKAQKSELQSIVEILCIPEPSDWVKRFPDEFYEHLYRLVDFYPDPEAKGHPGIFARLTKELIYDYLPPAVYWEIKRCKAESEGWEKLHQFLSPEGLELLQAQQKRVIEHMRGAESLLQLQRSVYYASTGRYAIVPKKIRAKSI